MADGHGGYRKPRRPAPVSGPGRLSRRTDGGPAQNAVDLPNARYGENRDFQEMQAGGDMAASPMPGPAAGGGGGGMDMAGLAALLGGGAGGPAGPPTPLTNPTERPDEPLTAGAPVGPGPGPSPEVVAPNPRRISEVFERLLGDDLTGELADLYEYVRRQSL